MNLVPTASPNMRQLEGITTARFFAALVVVFHHIYNRLPLDTKAHLPKLVEAIGLSGFVGVSFFFILSGFILTYTYSSRKMDLAKFFRARFARIYPVYFLMLFIYAALVGKQLISSPDGSLSTWNFFLHAFMLQAWGGIHANVLNPPGWTLCCELLFYLTFPLWIQWTVIRKHPLLVFSANWCLALLIPLATHFLYSKGLVSQAIGGDNVRIFPVAHVPQFLTGIALAHFLLNSENLETQYPLRWLFRFPGTALFFLAVGSLGVAAFASYAHFSILVNNGALVPLFGMIILLLSIKPPQWMTHQLAVFLGGASYSLYLVHLMILELFTDHGVLNFGQALSASVIAIMAASVVFHYYEEPMRRLLK